jgi:hypothetical protein
MPKKLLALATVVLGVLALAACGGTAPGPGAEPPGQTESPPTEPPPATEPLPDRYEYSDAPDAVVLDVTTGGGFVPVEVAVDTRPDFRLYGDGSVLVRPEEFELAFPALQTYELTPEGIQAVLQAADEAGLLAAGPDYGQPPVTDLPTTTLTVNLEGSSYSHGAYALGFDDETGLTAAQRDARERFAGFTAFLADLAATHPELLASAAEAYEPEAVRVYAWEREPQPGQKPPAWPLEPGIETWAGESSFGARCRTIAGPDLETLLGSLPQDWPLAWRSGGKQWSTGVALQLPGDAGCPPSA